MKTQCPNCTEIHDIHVQYKGKNIKCPNCQKPFVAEEYTAIMESKIEPDPAPKVNPQLDIPSSEIIYGFACFGIIVAILLLIFGILDKNSLIALGGLISLFLCPIILGISKIIDAVNANTLQKGTTEKTTEKK